MGECGGVPTCVGGVGHACGGRIDVGLVQVVSVWWVELDVSRWAGCERGGGWWRGGARGDSVWGVKIVGLRVFGWLGRLVGVG